MPAVTSPVPVAGQGPCSMGLPGVARHWGTGEKPSPPSRACGRPAGHPTPEPAPTCQRPMVPPWPAPHPTLLAPPAGGHLGPSYQHWTPVRVAAGASTKAASCQHQARGSQVCDYALSRTQVHNASQTPHPNWAGQRGAQPANTKAIKSGSMLEPAATSGWAPNPHGIHATVPREPT